MEGFAQQITDEEQKVKDQIARRTMKSVDKGFMGQIRTFFSSGSEDEDASQDVKLEGRLNLVCNQLASIFKVCISRDYTILSLRLNRVQAPWSRGAKGGFSPPLFAKKEKYREVNHQ